MEIVSLTPLGSTPGELTFLIQLSCRVPIRAKFCSLPGLLHRPQMPSLLGQWPDETLFPVISGSTSRVALAVNSGRTALTLAFALCPWLMKCICCKMRSAPPGRLFCPTCIPWPRSSRHDPFYDVADSCSGSGYLLQYRPGGPANSSAWTTSLPFRVSCSIESLAP